MQTVATDLKVRSIERLLDGASLAAGGVLRRAPETAEALVLGAEAASADPTGCMGWHIVVSSRKVTAIGRLVGDCQAFRPLINRSARPINGWGRLSTTLDDPSWSIDSEQSPERRVTSPRQDSDSQIEPVRAFDHLCVLQHRLIEPVWSVRLVQHEAGQLTADARFGLGRIYWNKGWTLRWSGRSRVGSPACAAVSRHRQRLPSDLRAKSPDYWNLEKRQ
jgi:hypothetical protein